MSRFAKIAKGEGFSKDLKKLTKRHRSLEDDLENFIKAQLLPYHKLQIDNHGIFPINYLGFESPRVYKAKKFTCKALKGKGAKSGIRVIYTYTPESDELFFIEIYSKSDKKSEDRVRIKELIETNFSLKI